MGGGKEREREWKSKKEGHKKSRPTYPIVRYETALGTTKATAQTDRQTEGQKDRQTDRLTRKRKCINVF